MTRLCPRIERFSNEAAGSQFLNDPVSAVLLEHFLDISSNMIGHDQKPVTCHANVLILTRGELDHACAVRQGALTKVIAALFLGIPLAHQVQTLVERAKQTFVSCRSNLSFEVSLSSIRFAVMSEGQTQP